MANKSKSKGMWWLPIIIIGVLFLTVFNPQTADTNDRSVDARIQGEARTPEGRLVQVDTLGRTGDCTLSGYETCWSDTEDSGWDAVARYRLGISWNLDADIYPSYQPYVHWYNSNSRFYIYPYFTAKYTCDRGDKAFYWLSSSDSDWRDCSSSGCPGNEIALSGELKFTEGQIQPYKGSDGWVHLYVYCWDYDAGSDGSWAWTAGGYRKGFTGYYGDCGTDNDCGATAICNVEAGGSCEEVECKTDSQCSGNNICVNNECVCTTNSDCGFKQVCQSQQCVDVECTADNQCTNGVCLGDNTCGCTFDSQCGEKNKCENSQCVPVECTSNDHCAVGVCQDYSCGCSFDSQCGPQMKCEASECVAVECTSNDHCTEGVCIDYECACAQNSDCAEQEVCSMNECVAVECTLDSHCTTGVCMSDNTCGCGDDNDCPAYNICTAGSCTQVECKVPEECAVGTCLADNTCGCTEDAQCPDQTVCDLGQCVGVDCTSDAHCGDNFVCQSNACWPDTDGDTIPDAQDNCDSIPNVNQADEDNDGIGDACDAPDQKAGVCTAGTTKWDECNTCSCDGTAWACTEIGCPTCNGEWVNGQCDTGDITPPTGGIQPIYIIGGIGVLGALYFLTRKKGKKR